MPEKIAVLGLGQIGGSLVLSLRKSGYGGSIHGIDISARRRNTLKQQLDTISAEYDSSLSADCVFVCLHYKETIDFLRRVPVDQHSLIIDCCSGKQKICRLAERRMLPFIGGHPIAGNEKRGEKGWDADLFMQETFFLCPIRSTSSSHIKRAKRIIRTLGANAVLIDAAAHDRFIARTSHFPCFLSVLLRETTTVTPAVFQGPGYRSMIRLSNTPHELQNTFLDSNGANVLRAATDFQKRLDRWVEEVRKKLKGKS